jgi:acetyltransferase
MDAHPLKPLLAPRSLIVLTDPPGQRSSEAERLLETLKAQRFHGEFAVADVQRSGTLAELAATRADLAVLALAAPALREGVELAGRMGCRAVLALGSGVPASEVVLLRELAQRERLHLLGPNTLGLQNPALGLNASLLGPLAEPGPLALVSQSGALAAAMLDWGLGNGLGFSQLVAVGPHSPVDVAELLLYLASCGRTQAILLHVEHIADARSFMSALRLAAAAKPVLVLKSGRQTRPAADASDTVRTHSALLAQREAVFDAALRRAGAVRVHSVVELVAAAKCLGSARHRGRVQGSRLALLGNGGGPLVLAADAADRLGLEITARQELDDPRQQLADAVLALQSRKDVDAVLALHAPLPPSEPQAVAEALAGAATRLSKPLLACWMGERSNASARLGLAEAGVPTFRTPEAAVGAFAVMAQWHAHQQQLQQTPYPLSLARPPDLAGARLLVDAVLAQRRSLLSEMESKALLAAFQVPVTQTLRARSAHEAMLIATQLGFPVALKIDADSITHKSEVDGVLLNLPDAASVRDAYGQLLASVRRALPQVGELGVTVQPMARQGRGAARPRELLVGLKRVEPFGPVLLFGAGGTQVELLADVAVELPPLNRFLAQRLMQRARAARLLKGLGETALEQLEALLLRVSEMACELPQLREMDINPVLIDAQGVVAVDARIVLAPELQVPGSSSYRHLAIAPYPSQLTQELHLRDGQLCTLRAIRPDDAAMLQQLVASLSPESRYNRFAATLTELPPALLARFTQIDYEREMALVAVRAASADGSEPERIVGVARYSLHPGGQGAEYALLVSDAFSGQGLGRRLMECLMAVAREQGLKQLDGLVLVKNHAMLRLMRALGFSVQAFEDDEDFKLVSRTLNP